MQYLALPDGAGSFGQDFSGPVLLRGSHRGTALTSTGLSPSVGRLSSPLRLRLDSLTWALQPRPAVARRFGLTPVRSPLLGGSLNCFLFLRVLRCFSSPRSLSQREYRPESRWVAPFGYLRIWAFVQLPAAFRSFTRPSSLAYAKASTIRPWMFTLYGLHLQRASDDARL